MKKQLIAPNLTLFDLSMNEPLFSPEEVLEGLLASEKGSLQNFFMIKLVLIFSENY